MTQADAVAAELGRHYVAGHLEADELDERLGRLYAAPDSAVALLEGLPELEPAVPGPPPPQGLVAPPPRRERRCAPGLDPTSERFLDPTTTA